MPGPGSKLRAEPQRRRPEQGTPFPGAVGLQQRGAGAKGRPDPAPGGGNRPGMGTMRSSGGLSRRRGRKDALGSGREQSSGSPEGTQSPSAASVAGLSPAQPRGTFCPPPPALRWSGTPSGSGSPYPSRRWPRPAEGQRESAGGQPRDGGAAAHHRPRHSSGLGARREAHLNADGRAPLPLPSQAPQLFPAGNGLDDERGGLGSGAGLDRRQVEGHGRHLGALQALGRVAARRGIFGPGGAAGDLAGQVALVGGLGAALRRDGDEGFGFGSWRDGRWSFSVTEGCCGRGAG